MSNEQLSPEQEHYNLLLKLGNECYEHYKRGAEETKEWFEVKSETYDFCLTHFYATCLLMGKPINVVRSNRQKDIEVSLHESVKDDAEHEVDDLKDIKFG